MMPCKIFISYHREDSNAVAAWLYDRLVIKFGDGAVFVDKESIILGELWEEKINNKLDESQLVLAIIGKNWLDATDEEGSGISNKVSYWVRKELEMAFNKNKTVIPILVDKAEMPNVEILPGRIKDLSTIQGFNLYVSPGPNSSFDDLVDQIKNQIKPLNTEESLHLVVQEKYEIIKEIGKGRTSHVFLARDTALGRKVAIKVIAENKYEEDFIATLEKAGKILDRTPYCVQVYGAWIKKKPYHAVMSYLAGGTLREKIDDAAESGKKILPNPVHKYLLQLGYALTEIHAAGYQHCNVKPSNVLLSAYDVANISPLCMLDKVTEKNMRQKVFTEERDPGEIFYKEDLCYLAPEIFDVNYADFSAMDKEKIDQYMLGLLGLELLVGKISPEVSTFIEIKNRSKVVGAKVFEDFGTITAAIDNSELLNVIKKMINPNPCERYDKLSDAVRQLSKIKFDEFAIARKSYDRCLQNKLHGINPGEDFFKIFYENFLKNSAEARAKLQNMKNIDFYYQKLQTAILHLFAFAENMDNRIHDKDAEEPTVLDDDAIYHEKKRIHEESYQEFLETLKDTVALFDSHCKDPAQRQIIMKAWDHALKPGIDYMKTHAINGIFHPAKSRHS